MDQADTTDTTSPPGGGNTLPEIALVERQGEPRALDTDIGERLGMARPTNIRALIEANRVELEGFGSLHAARAMIRTGKGAKREGSAFYLNEEQALLISTISKAPNAPAVRAMLIRTFVAWRRGHLEAPPIDMRALGGINKGVVRKAIADMVPEIIIDALSVVLPAMVKEQVGARQHAVIQGVSAGQVIAMAGVMQRKGLRGLAAWVSNRLRRYHADKGIAVRIASLGSRSAYVFDPFTSREWLAAGGRTEIEQKIAERRGQLRLV